MENGNSTGNINKPASNNNPDSTDSDSKPIEAVGFEQIAPAQVTLTAAPEPEEKQHWTKTYRNQLLALAALVLLLLGVFFVLPNTIEPVDKEVVADAVKPAKPAGNIESPWRDAQLAKERREAQEILSEMLKLQTSLEDKAVEQWATDAYKQALETATSADTLYRQREFTQAQGQYREALNQFNALLTQAVQVFSESLTEGATAVEAGEAEQALAAYQLALAIDPISADANAGLARAQVLEQVLALLHQGELLQKTGHFEEAQKQYLQAQTLDSASPPVQTKLVEIKQAILERDFTEAMSSGYAALNSQAFDKAIGAFKSALTLKPNAVEVRTALDQTRNQKTQSQIQRLLTQAQAQEAQEGWQLAADAFKKALALDSSLVQARIGQIRTQARADFDKEIVSALSQPERLATDSVYRQTQQLFSDAKAMQNPGPRLQQQTVELAKLLQVAVTPIAIRLQSDNETDVTLYKVGHLGNFVTHEMTLKPGRYTAVGTRDGYRNVRQEFTVSAEKPQQTIVIQCVEKVSLDG